MSTMTALIRIFLLRGALIVFTLGGLAACGGGGSVSVFVPAAQPVVAPLGMTLTRVGPQAIAVDWSDDSYVASFLVLRDGYRFANVNTTSLVDASVFINETYCYQVQGYDASGLLVAASSPGCITVYP